MEYSSNEMVKHNRNAASSAGEQMGSVTYQVVQQNLETWLLRRRAGGLDAGADWVVDPVPVYVERDLRKYLECATLSHGFSRARCEKCGQDFLVAYSCKGCGVRGVRVRASY